MVRKLGMVFSPRVALLLAIERVDGRWLLLTLACCRYCVGNPLVDSANVRKDVERLFLGWHGNMNQKRSPLLFYRVKFFLFLLIFSSDN